MNLKKIPTALGLKKKQLPWYQKGKALCRIFRQYFSKKHLHWKNPLGSVWIFSELENYINLIQCILRFVHFLFPEKVLKNRVFLTNWVNCDKAGQWTNVPPLIFKIALKNLFQIDSDWLFFKSRVFLLISVEKFICFYDKITNTPCINHYNMFWSSG